MNRPAGGKSYPMSAVLWLPAVVRALATALLVVLASALAESVGPFWGAFVASMPMSAGPTYVFLAMQHEPDFVAASALTSCAANAAAGLFLIAYGLQPSNAPLWKSLGAALLAWFAACLVIRQISWTPVTALLANLVVFGAGSLLLSVVPRENAKPVTLLKRQWFELPLRAIVVALFVTLVVGTSSLLGPDTTGIAAVFPIILTSLIVILRRRIGGAAVTLFVANALRSMLGFGLMLLALHLAIRPWGFTVAFLVALAVSASWSGAMLALRTRTPSG